MSKDKQRSIASKGGRAAHLKGTAHEWTAEEAKAAGRKGGLAVRARKQSEAGTVGTLDVPDIQDPLIPPPLDPLLDENYQAG